MTEETNTAPVETPVTPEEPTEPTPAEDADVPPTDEPTPAEQPAE